MRIRNVLRGPGLLLMTAAMLSMSIAFAADELETITVTAGAMVKTVVGHSTIGAPIEEVTLTHHVSFADLDIGTHTGAMALKRRVEETAHAACKQLDELYPKSGESRSTCVRHAIAGATEQINQAIEAAEHKAKNE